jgi:hypothetical protein
MNATEIAANQVIKGPISEISFFELSLRVNRANFFNEK